MEIDRLTDDLLIKILTSLSLKESGKTSVLARRWRYLWGFSNKILRFDYTDNSSRLDFSINEKFQTMVKNVLLHQRTRDIDGVIISNYDVDAEFTPLSSPAVDSWMKYLMRKKVGRVELYLTPDSRYTFPNYAASNLKTLRLAHVGIKDSTVQDFLSCCPNLEELSILSSSRTKNIRVLLPPKLKVFEVSRCLHMEGVVITDATDLVSLKYEGGKDSLELTNIPNLRHLTLSGDFGLLFVFEPKEEWSYPAQLEKLVLDFQFLDTEIRSLDASHVPKLCSLKRLELQLYKIQHGSLLFITSLIEASPQLRELKIELSYPLTPSKLNKGKSWFPDIKEAKGVKFVHTKLKVVEMVGFVGCSSETDLLMQLCKRCPKIEKIVINTESDYYDHPLPGRALPHFSACDGCLPEIGANERGEARRRAKKDSISTVSSDYSCCPDLSFGITGAFEFLRWLSESNFTTTRLVWVVQDVQLSDQRYLAAGTKAVIKSLNSVKITEDEFEQHMTVLGNCRHENVATPSAYHFSDTTKLVVYDYYGRGSVFDMLQRNKSRPSWERRLRIAIGAARGIAHIHTQCGGEMVHGYIKSSNVFLNRQGYGCVSDFGLAGIVERPKKSRHGIENPLQKNDVYSFGLLLIELITREPPVQAFYVVDRLLSFQPYEWKFRSIRHKTLLLVDEVAEMEEGSSLFVDEKLLARAVQKELRKMLEVAKRCLALLPEERPAMSQVVLDLELNDIADSSLLPKEEQFPPPLYQNSVSSDLRDRKSGDKKRV